MDSRTQPQYNDAGEKLIADIENFITQYVTFDTPGYSLVAALWTVATYLHPHFDVFPYLVVTSGTKRSGKTRFGMEVLGCIASNPRKIVGATPATIFTMIRDSQPTLLIDEAEPFSSESAGAMRSILNSGYKRGATVPRMSKEEESGVKEWPTYCPKVFVSIGDMYDTLMDRSIVFRMVRGEPRRRFMSKEAESEGNEIGMRAKLVAEELLPEIADAYATTRATFLSDRDEEIWLALFAVAQVLCARRMPELQALAVDMSTEKTMPRKKYTATGDDEQQAELLEYSERLLHDMLEATNGDKVLYTADALARLKALPLAPWRKYKGDGLNDELLASLLKPHGVKPSYIRTGKKVARGYRREHIEAAVAKL